MNWRRLIASLFGRRSYYKNASLCITAKLAARWQKWVKTRMPPQHPYVFSSRLRTCRLSDDVREVPNSVPNASQQTASLLDDLVGTREQRRRQFQPERLD